MVGGVWLKSILVSPPTLFPQVIKCYLPSVSGHVHAGNVLICDGNCKLVDIENSLMGIPSLYRHHLIEVKKLRVSKKNELD